jgi:hypothetical protein
MHAEFLAEKLRGGVHLANIDVNEKVISEWM